LQVILINGHTIDHGTRTQAAVALLLSQATTVLVVRHPRELLLERKCAGEEWGLELKHRVIAAVYEGTAAAAADVRAGYGILAVNGCGTAGASDADVLARLEAQVCSTRCAYGYRERSREAKAIFMACRAIQPPSASAQSVCMPCWRTAAGAPR
jgi:hypothetical protein